MTKEENPYLKPENYYAGYEEGMEKLKNKPEALEMDKLCYFVFNTEEGKRLMSEIVDRFLLPGFIHPNGTNLEYAAIYYEGFKEGFRMLRNCVKSHEQRIAAENLNK
tara:strand:+ start:830 stop:1150 length:321 start_codon:yes stop_codon:yes gene_type:complete